MKILMRFFVLAAMLGCILSSSSTIPVCAETNKNPEGETIYGNDDRLDLYQVQDPRLLIFADSTVALFENASVTLDPSAKRAKLKTQVFGEKMKLCKNERFYSQPMGAFCSGSLVGPDLIMTAGHCVKSQEACVGTKFVFGFSVRKKGESPTSVPVGEVYACKQLVGRQQDNEGADWALVKLDRPVANHKPLKVNRAGAIADNTPIVVIGHPVGLPTKVAGGARVRTSDTNGYFVANLDTFGGNSGSAVFNAQTGLVEGILVRGDNDFEEIARRYFIWRYSFTYGQCRASRKCPDDGCRGEDVTKISALLDLIPQWGASMDEAHFQQLDPQVFADLMETAGKQADALKQ